MFWIFIILNFSKVGSTVFSSNNFNKSHHTIRHSQSHHLHILHIHNFVVFFRICQLEDVFSPLILNVYVCISDCNSNIFYNILCIEDQSWWGFGEKNIVDFSNTFNFLSILVCLECLKKPVERGCTSKSRLNLD